MSTLAFKVNPDDYLPSVMTCANYLKLPDYSSKVQHIFDILVLPDFQRRQSWLSMVQGFHCFHGFYGFQCRRSWRRNWGWRLRRVNIASTSPRLHAWLLVRNSSVMTRTKLFLLLVKIGYLHKPRLVWYPREPSTGMITPMPFLAKLDWKLNLWL